MNDQAAIKPPAPPHWVEALERSREDVAAGRIVPSDVVHARLQRSIEALQAEQVLHDQE
jgi:predicted ABC-type ATPase